MKKNKTTIIIISTIFALVIVYFLYQQSIKNDPYRQHDFQVRKFNKAMNLPKDFNFEIEAGEYVGPLAYEVYEQQLESFNKAKGEVVAGDTSGLFDEQLNSGNKTPEIAYEELVEQFNKAMNIE